MRRARQPLQVEAPEGIPRFVRWKGRRQAVQVLDRWDWRGRWWKDPGLQGESRAFFRIAVGGTTMEIYCEKGAWTLSRLTD